MYSNGAFEILGYALENITGRSMEEMFMKDLVKPMNLTGMSYTMPKNGTPAVIPGSDASSWWNYDMGDKTP
jgi:CubicO group peptidase (beta-lactamase class C family)